MNASALAFKKKLVSIYGYSVASWIWRKMSDTQLLAKLKFHCMYKAN